MSDALHCDPDLTPVVIQALEDAGLTVEPGAGPMVDYRIIDPEAE